MIIKTRPYAGETDLYRVIEFRRACTTAENLYDFPTVSDLRELLDPLSTETAVNTHLWEDAKGTLLAFAMVYLPYGNLYFQLHPQARGSDIEEQVIEWATKIIQGVVQERGERVTLDASCRENDTALVALLEQHGFVQQAEQTLRMVRSLAEPIPVAQFPEGFMLRHVEDENEVEEYVAMHRDAFGTNNMTVEHRLSIMRNPDYRPELDLIAVAPDGTFAAFCICNNSREANATSGRNEGEIGIIGTRTAFRGKGLGKSMLLAGLQILKAHGIETATLGTSTSNPNAIRLYQSAGFRLETTILWFTKEV